MSNPAEKVASLSSYCDVGAGSKALVQGNGGGKPGDIKSKPVIVKKYANRRLYNTETSSYVTLEDLGEMVRSERDFLVYDAKTGEDLTHSVLTQIIVEEEGKSGQNLLPVGFLRQLIRFYGQSLEQIVPKYLELSIETLTREQEKYRQQLTSAFGGPTFEAMQEQARQNMVMFERAMSMFSPFGIIETTATQHGHPLASPAREQEKAQASTSEIAELKAQLNEMKERLDKLSEKPEGQN